jgi:hypothetical protein
MERIMDRLNILDVIRWSLSAVVVGLGLWLIPDLRAAERLPVALQVVRGVGTVTMLVLTGFLVRARHEQQHRKFLLGVSVVTLMLLEGALRVSFNPKSAAILVVWAVLVWIEWRRLVDEERRFA